MEHTGQPDSSPEQPGESSSESTTGASRRSSESTTGASRQSSENPLPDAGPVLPSSTRSRLMARVQPLVPWFSLALGVMSALLMERRPTHGGRIAFAALAVWLLILLQRWLARIP